MQILHRFAGSVQQYIEQLADPDCYRPGHCPQCHTKHPLTAHGFYTRTIIDTAFTASFPCAAASQAANAISLLPEFVVLPAQQRPDRAIFIAVVLRAERRRALPGCPTNGQFWLPLRARLKRCACAGRVDPATPAPDLHRALTGPPVGHSSPFPFAGVRYLLGGSISWPDSAAVSSAAAPA